MHCFRWGIAWIDGDALFLVSQRTGLMVPQIAPGLAADRPPFCLRTLTVLTTRLVHRKRTDHVSIGQQARGSGDLGFNLLVTALQGQHEGLKDTQLGQERDQLIERIHRCTVYRPYHIAFLDRAACSR